MSDTKAFEDILVQAGVSVEKAKAKIAQLTAHYTSKGLDAAGITKQLHIDVVRLASVLASTTEVTGVVVGFTELKDSNDYDKREALKAYKLAPDEAVAKGIVGIVGGQAVALDHKQYLDNEKTKENPSYGKPLGTVMQRSVLIWTDNKILTAFGNVNVSMFTQYKFRGSMSKKGNLTLSSQVAPIPLGIADTKQLYAEFTKLLQTAPEAHELADAIKLPAKSFVMVPGYIGDSGESRNGGSHITLMADGLMQGVKVFYRATESTADIAGIPQGTNVIVIGKMGDLKDQRNPQAPPSKIINGLGIVRAVESSLIERAPKDKEEMDAILFD